MSFFTSKQVVAAEHTLWQAAVASGGITTAIQAAQNHSLVDAKQGLIVAGTAVVGAGLSLAKATVLNWTESHKTSKAAQVIADAEKFAKAVADYKAALGPAAVTPAPSATLPADPAAGVPAPTPSA